MNSRTQPPQYRIIFNWDGDSLAYGEHPQSTQQIVDQVFVPLEGTQVDAMFWSIGSHEALFPSDKHQRERTRLYDSVRAMRHDENVWSLFDKGENPYQAMVERGHELGMHVYVSMRMNDNHFYNTRPHEFKKLNKGTKLRQDHPEWLLDVGDVPEQRGVGSWNMASLGVREHKLSYIREACAQADWDGVEIDWQRHPHHLPQFDSYRLRYTLTDLQRALRQMADEIATEKGRPFHVAVRVATTLESCRRIGYDIPEWTKNGLCDIIIGAGGSATDPGFEVDEFKRHTEGTGIRLYGGFDTTYRQEAARLMPYTRWRDGFFSATSAGYLDQGVDGVYCFNWFPKKDDWGPLLKSMGTLETLKNKDKLYSVLRRGPSYVDGVAPNAVNDRIHGETATVLLPTLTGDGPTFTISLHDDVVAQAAQITTLQLQIEIAHWAPEDEVEASLDGETLGAPTIKDVAADNDQTPPNVSENKWLIWDLRPAQIDKGVHTIKVVLVKRDSRLAVPLTIEHVDVHVRYR
jgi:hypothetical protein